MNTKMFRIYGSILLLIIFSCLPSFATTACGSGDCTGMVEYYEFEEGSGNHCIGSFAGVAISSNASFPASWTWTTGIAGNAVHFGSNQGAESNASNFDIYGKAITVEGWIKTTGTATQDTIWGNADDSQYTCRIMATTLLFRLYLYPLTYYYSVTAVSTGTWHNLTFTYDGANVIIYLDGNADSTTPETRAMADTGASTFFRIGTYGNCDIDEVAVYNTALTQTNIQDHISRVNAGGHICPYTTAGAGTVKKKLIQIINSQ